MRNDLATTDVSASGLHFRSDVPHDLETGDRLEVQLFARVRGRKGEDTLILATDAIVVRVGDQTAALRFEAPLMY